MVVQYFRDRFFQSIVFWGDLRKPVRTAFHVPNINESRFNMAGVLKNSIMIVVNENMIADKPAAHIYPTMTTDNIKSKLWQDIVGKSLP